MRFLIDGYNLMHAVGLAPARTAGPRRLLRARRTLLDRLAAIHHDPAHAVIVVFDAKEATNPAPTQDSHRGLSVRFAVGGLADDFIIERIRQEPNPAEWVVVSNDHRVQVAVTRRGGQAWTCHRYLDWTEQAQPPPAKPPLPSKPEQVSKAEVEEWLRFFGETESP